jgi:hypothetical protein
LGNSTPEIRSQFGNSGGFNASKFSKKRNVKPKTGAQLDEFGVPEKDYENDYLKEKSVESEEDFSDGKASVQISEAPKDDLLVFDKAARTTDPEWQKLSF